VTGTGSALIGYNKQETETGRDHPPSAVDIAPCNHRLHRHHSQATDTIECQTSPPDLAPTLQPTNHTHTHARTHVIVMWSAVKKYKKNLAIHGTSSRPVHCLKILDAVNPNNWLKYLKAQQATVDLSPVMTLGHETRRAYSTSPSETRRSNAALEAPPDSAAQMTKHDRIVTRLRCETNDTYGLFKSNEFCLRECVRLCNDWNDVHLVMNCTHEWNVQWLQPTTTTTTTCSDYKSDLVMTRITNSLKINMLCIMIPISTTSKKNSLEAPRT